MRDECKASAAQTDHRDEDDAALEAMTRPVIAVTGHRRLEEGAVARLLGEVQSLVHQYPDATWRLGGAVGADQIVGDYLAECDGIKIEVILAGPLEDHTAKWDRSARERLDVLLGWPNVTVNYAASGGVDYRKRNRMLLDGASMLLAAWSGNPRTGTGMTVRMAKDALIPIRWIPVKTVTTHR